MTERDADGVYTTVDDLVRLRAKASGFSFLPRQPVFSVLAGRRASRLRGRGLDFDELRRYLPGDDVRAIDWRATARARRAHVRVYTEERDRPVLFVVDQRMSMFFGSVRRTKSVTAAEAAALGTWRALSQGDRVGAVVFSDERVAAVRPRRSNRAAMQVLAEVVRANHALDADGGARANSDRLDEALRSARRLANHDHLVVVISDFAGIGEESARIATDLARHNDVMAVFVHDPLERELPRAGRLAFRSEQGQIEVDTGDAALRERFRSDFDERRAATERLLRSREIPVLPIDTVDDVAEQVRRVLGLRRGTV